MRHPKTLLFVSIGLAVAGTGRADVNLVENGASGHAIYHAAEAPGSVKTAAAELRKYVREVTGADLPIVNEPRPAMICLGDNEAARAAGLSASGMPLEGFRVVTRGADLFILGPDTADGVRTPGGGTSAGTRNGVYAFIEERLGVRWLLPGETGDFVPKAASLVIPETDKSDAPFFLNRRLPYIQPKRREVRQWSARQKLGLSLSLNHGHNWRAIPRAAFDKHPDWFAEHGGARVPPAGGAAKLCATSEGMIRAFADAAIGHFDKYPHSTCYSLSPSDGGGWCACAKCKALYETDPNGKLSVTPAILNFYNGVAKLVAEKHPDRFLAGYVYAAYVFPPHSPIKLAPNVFLVWAPSFDYGFTLHRPELQKQWEALVAQWTKVTENISYYDLPNCVHNSVGAPNPPGLKILKFLYPRIKRARMKGVYVYGNQAWGHSAPMNYLLARLAWDPDADVEALFNEFCDKAYGSGAEEMKRFYRLLDEDTERYFLANPESYTLSSGRLRDVYAHNFAELERLYRTAEGKIRDADAAARLNMLGLNLRVLHWNMRQLGLLKSPEASGFHLSDDAFTQFLKTHQGTLALYPEERRRRIAAVDRPLSVTPAENVPNAEPASKFRLRGAQRIVLRPAGDGPVRIKFGYLRSYGALLWCYVYDPTGKEVARHVANAGKEIVLAETPKPYCHLVIGARSSFYELQVAGASWALDGRINERGLHLIQKTTPLYFEVPAGLTSFRIWLAATPPGETAAASLYAPDGREAARFDCAAKSIDQQTIAVGPDDAGFWKMAIRPASVGVVDDVWVKLGEKLPGFLSPVAERALSVRAGGAE